MIRSAISVVVLLLAAPTQVWAQRGASVGGNGLADVRAYFEHAATEEVFSGVVLVARGDTVVFEEAYGLADRDLRVPVRTDHRFRIGSLTKPVTASAVMVAIDRGLLALDIRVCDVLSPCPESWTPVTVRHLLTHTSGITDHFGDLAAVPVDETLAELRRVLGSLSTGEPLEAPPGTEYAYSNFNYVLLGALLEEAVGAGWPALIHDWIAGPLQLSTVVYDDVYAIIGGRVRGYVRDETGGLRNIEYSDHGAYAAGGLLASAGDLFRWSRAVLTGHLFSGDLLDQSLTPFRGGYGFGWQVRRFFDRPVYNHTGGIDGFSSHLAHYPEQRLTIIVFSNIENDPAILRACDTAARVFDWPNAGGPDAPDLTPRQRCGLEP